MAEEEKENNKPDFSEDTIPPITTEEREILKNATARDYVQMIRIMTRVKEYVNINGPLALLLRNDALKVDNQSMMMYQQGSHDILLDLDNILQGNNLMTIYIKPKNGAGMETV